MKIILRPRASGKTTELIKIAAKGRYKIIVVQDYRMVDIVWRKMLQMEKDKIIDFHPPQPITYREFLEDRKSFSRTIEAVLIDNADIFLQWLSSTPIEAITLNQE